MLRLVDEVLADWRAHSGRWRLVLLGCLYGLLTAILVFLVFGITNLTKLNEDAKAQRELLIECTTPPGEREPPVPQPGPGDCFLRSQAATRQAVQDIGQVSVIAAACGAAHPGDVPATRSCVENALQEETP